MELTIDEFSILCKIADLSTVVGVELKGILSQEEANLAYAGLESKNIIKDTQLTEFGLALGRSLIYFSKADEYINLGNIILGKYAPKEYVGIRQKDNMVHILLHNQDQLVVLILSKFTSIKTIQDQAYQEHYISRNTFYEEMEKNKDVEALFYYRYKSESKEQKHAVLYIKDGYLNHYSGEEEMEKCYPRQQVQEGIERIFQ